MRFTRFLKEDVVSKALEISEPEYKKKYDPDIAERYMATLQIAIQKLREKYKGNDYDPETDVDNPELEADEAKLKDLQDKYNKWEKIASGEAEKEEAKPQAKPQQAKPQQPEQPEQQQPEPEEQEAEAEQEKADKEKAEAEKTKAETEEQEAEGEKEEAEEEQQAKKKKVKESKLRSVFETKPPSMSVNPLARRHEIQRKQREKEADRKRAAELQKNVNINNQQYKNRRTRNKQRREDQEAVQRRIQSRIKLKK